MSLENNNTEIEAEEIAFAGQIAHEDMELEYMEMVEDDEFAIIY
jgi:hypothetical protein